MYASLTLARLGLDVRALVGVDAVASRSEELQLLRSADVLVTLAALDSGPIFDNVLHRCLATSDRIAPAALPRAWTTGFDALLFAPVAGELGDEWALLTAGEPGPIVALGWQGLLRTLFAGDAVRTSPPASSPLVQAARLVVVSREDVAPGTQPEDLMALLQSDATLAWTEGVAGGLVLTRGEGGGMLRSQRYPAIPSDRVVDPTGAGDVFLAAMLAVLLQPSLAEGLAGSSDAGSGDAGPGDAGPGARFAAAAASLVVEAPGLAGVPDLAATRRRAERAPSRASRRPRDASSPGVGRPSQD
jgi:sugar/nucleoside kinase (ribokinase family)